MLLWTKGFHKSIDCIIIWLSSRFHLYLEQIFGQSDPFILISVLGMSHEDRVAFFESYLTRCQKCLNEFVGRRIRARGFSAQELAEDDQLMSLLTSICEDILQVVSVGVEMEHAQTKAELNTTSARKRNIKRVAVTQFVRRVGSLGR